MLKYLMFVTLLSGINCDLQFNWANVTVHVEQDALGPFLNVLRDGVVVQTIWMDSEMGENITETAITDGITLNGTNGITVTLTLDWDETDFSVIKLTREFNRTQTVQDCVSLGENNTVQWYGGPQQKYQYWPIQTMKYSNYSYVPKEADNCGVAERYWVNSNGVFIYIAPEAPLFIEQNTGQAGYLCLVTKNALPYYTHSTEKITFTYSIGVASDAKVAHMKAVKRYLGRPSGYPAEVMVREPIWSTWARYKRLINESVVTAFADEIIDSGFKGQYEIDDDWEICYGALSFSKSKFPDILNLTTILKDKGFRVTLWIHPFINKGCEPWYSEAKANGYLVQNTKGVIDTSWWNSNTDQAAYIDFTKPAAAEWFTDRLKLLQTDAGIDSFKFDAGETSWTPQDPILNGSLALHPNLITTEYVKTVAKFGSLVEVRAGQLTQTQPVFIRMIDKDSEWHWNNGLPTLITTLFQLNMAGYPLVLPDMIGGNGYDDRPPSKEMFIRWLQTNVFMPSLQFSFVPWDYDNETTTIALKFVELHANYTEVIMERFQLAVATGEPVNPPIWWVDPTDTVALGINDQFLLGDSIISAPAIRDMERYRDIYLPNGTWLDGNNQSLYTGPQWLIDYPVPLDVLPYFIKQ